MIVLKDSPKNTQQFSALVSFFKEVLLICDQLSIAPVVDGSLAYFAYTHDTSICVNDIDVSVPESDFVKLLPYFEKLEMEYELKPWHVLRVQKNDLRIEFGSREAWLKDIPLTCETLDLGERHVDLLSLSSLTLFYKRAMNERAHKIGKGEQQKYQDFKAKYLALKRLA